MNLCVLILKFIIIKHVIAYWNKPKLFEDESVLREVTHEGLKSVDEEVLRSFAKNYAFKFHTKHLNPVLTYTGFTCSLNEIRSDLSEIYPKYASWKGWDSRAIHNCFTEDILYDFPLPKKLDKTIKAFGTLEKRYNPEIVVNRAEWKIEEYFETMVAYLHRHDLQDYKHYLTERSLNDAQTLEKAIYKTHYKARKPSKLQKKYVITNFASFYARIRFGENLIRYSQHLDAVRQSEVNLPLQLYNRGLLSAWGFNEDDLRYINMLRKLHRPEQKKSHSGYFIYEFEINGRNISGILPTIDLKTCPHFQGTSDCRTVSRCE